MDIGVEGLAHFPGNVETVVLERVEEQLPGHDHAGEQAFTGFVAAAVLNGEIKAVQRGQEILEHRLAGVAHVFVMVTLDAFLEIFHLREGAQPGFVRFGLDRASGANLFAELLLKRFFRGLRGFREVLFGGVVLSLFGLGITCIGHASSLMIIFGDAPSP